MKYSVRNNLEATVKSIKSDEMMAQIDHTLNSTADLSSVLTTDSLQELGIKPSDKVKLFVKAIHIIPVKE